MAGYDDMEDRRGMFVDIARPIDETGDRLAVIGAGIVGLAHAWAAARLGWSVTVYERSPKALGASIRNFGMIWPIGQPLGERRELALRSRARWLEAAQRAGFDLRECGSLHLAYEQDELAVMDEFVASARATGAECEMLPPSAVGERARLVNPQGLLGALWSPTECSVDPREVLSRLPIFLQESYDIEFHYNTTVTAVLPNIVCLATGQYRRFDHVLICSGSDFETLFPTECSSLGLRRCKLQMLRTVAQPKSLPLGPHIAGGLTLGHYRNFAECPSLPRLKRRLAFEYAEYLAYGIHVMVAQNQSCEIVIGDSHEYEDDISIFDKPRIDELILEYLNGMIRMPNPTIAERWHGIYAKHPEEAIVYREVKPGIELALGAGGTGLTLSFGLADEWARPPECAEPRYSPR